MILALDTAAPEGGVALLHEAKIVSADLGPLGKHAELVVTRVEELLQQMNSQPKDVSSVVVNVGPGSFTGIRIGIAAALGFAESLGVSAGGLGGLSIQAWAWMLAHPESLPNLVYSCADVRRGEVALSTIEVKDAHLNVLIEPALQTTARPSFEPRAGSAVLGVPREMLWEDRDDLTWWTPTGPERAVAAAYYAANLKNSIELPYPEPFYSRPADAKPPRV